MAYPLKSRRLVTGACFYLVTIPFNFRHKSLVMPCNDVIDLIYYIQMYKSIGNCGDGIQKSTAIVCESIGVVMLKRIFRRKFTTWSSEEEQALHHENVEQNHSLFDLLCIGVGATVGSGVFVLTGLVAHSYAGPGVVVSWAVAGLACGFSAMSYAELSASLPSPGSSYSYVYRYLGELPAYLAAYCLSLECGMSAAAVARNWGVKLSNFLGQSAITSGDQDQGLNVYSGLLMAATVFLFLLGSDASKLTINIFTVVKILLILFMIACGWSLFQPRNIEHFAPMGVTGIMRGATSCFFGFVGYDEVCCMALETKNPQESLPIAVFGTIFIVSALYMLSSFALVGMQSYDKIDSQSGFAVAFYDNGYIIPGNITALGELITLPLVVIVSFLPQPRILYAMAKDHLCPQAFATCNNKGVFVQGVLYSGVVCTLIAFFVPFSALDDVISAGVLLSFNMTNCCVILRRMDPGANEADSINSNNESLPSFRNLSLCKRWIVVYCIACLVFSITMTQMAAIWSPASLGVFGAFGILGLIAIAIVMYYQCPEIELPSEVIDFTSGSGMTSSMTSTSDVSSSAHGSTAPYHQHAPAPIKPPRALYRVPYVPFTPLIGIFINFYLVCQLSLNGVLMLGGYFLLACVVYFSYTTLYPNTEGDNSAHPNSTQQYNPLSNQASSLHGMSGHGGNIEMNNFVIEDEDEKEEEEPLSTQLRSNRQYSSIAPA